MSSIRSILEDYVFKAMNEFDDNHEIIISTDKALKDISELIDGVIVDVQPIQMFRNIPDSSTTRTAQDLQVETIARTIIAKQLNNLKELLK